MDGVGKLFHHATGKYGTGHTILKVCLHYRGVTIPWGSWLWLKPKDARKLDRPFVKLTQLAARTGWMKKLGEVQVIFSRRRGEPKVLAPVTNDLRASAKSVVADYLKRWAIEEFFNAYQKMGWNRAGTQNLHIRYGQMSLALAAQAVVHQVRQRLDCDRVNWDAEHLSKGLFRGLEGDIRVWDDTIALTYYNAPNAEHYRRQFENTPARLAREAIDPRIR